VDRASSGAWRRGAIDQAEPQGEGQGARPQLEEIPELLVLGAGLLQIGSGEARGELVDTSHIGGDGRDGVHAHPQTVRLVPDALDRRAGSGIAQIRVVLEAHDGQRGGAREQGMRALA